VLLLAGQEYDRVASLIAQLKSQYERTRSDAAEALGKIKDTRAVEPLMAVLAADEDCWVRQSAGHALGMIGDPRAVTSLITAIYKDRCFNVISRSAAALGAIGDPKAIDALLQLATTGDRVAYDAAEALSKVHNSRAVEGLLALSDDGDPRVRGRALWALREAKDSPNALNALIAALKDSDDKVRSYAARALVELGDPRAVGPLVAAMKSESTTTAASARALCKFRDRRAVDQLIEALNDENRMVKVCAATALGAVKNPKCVPALIAALKSSDPSWDTLEISFLRDAVADALGKIGDLRAVDSLVALALDRGLPGHSSAVQALRRMNDPSLVSAASSYLLLIQQGKKATEDTLIAVLYVYGDKNMAVNYLNCGNVRLKQAATDWASGHGYEVVNFGGQTPAARWGRK
jgi:HEAT repeat protein